MKSVASRFSAAAATYDAEASVQRGVARRLMAILDGTPSAAVPERILEVGCGTGFLTRLLAARYSSSMIVATDIACRMVQRAARSVVGMDQIRWLAADARTVSLRTGFDLVASSSSLHWVTPLGAAFANLRPLLGAGGRLACALMVDGTLAELHAARCRVAPAKSSQGTLLGSDAVRRCVEEQGFRIDEMVDETIRARYDSAHGLLYSLHALGLTAGAVFSGSGHLNRLELRKLEEDYDLHYSADNGVYASYRILYLTATVGVEVR